MKMICEDCGATIKKSDHYLEKNGFFYCENCITICEECQQEVPISETKYIESSSMTVCQDCIDESYTYCHDCDELVHNEQTYYIDSEDYYVCESCRFEYYCACNDCGLVFPNDDLYYDEDTDCNYCSDCNSSREDRPVFKYHSCEGRGDRSEDYRYRVGIELEREDGEFRDSLDKYDFLDKTGWVVERDCSLDDEIGFEAISPILPLKLGELEKLFSTGDLLKLARTEYSGACGGHITISDKKRTPSEIIDDIAGYLPLIYALFPNRVCNSYCSPRRKEVYKESGGHIALNKRGDCKGSGLEIRLFDAPRDEKDILNRFKLLKYILQHKATTVEKGLENLNNSEKLRKAVKYHLDTYKIPYKTFYTNLVSYAKSIDCIEVKANGDEIEKTLSKK